MNTLLPAAVVDFQPALLVKRDLKSESSPYSQHCQIKAGNDWEAVFSWLYEYAHKKNSYLAYKREGLRLLLWCSYEAAKSLNDLKKEDLEAYFLFCQGPPLEWCQQKSREWRPFRGPLGRSTLLATIRILNSCFNYLVQADYLRANPLRLIKGYAKWSLASQQRRHQVWTRILDNEEWQAVQQALIDMPETNPPQRESKLRTQFLFALLYFLGLRIHEVASHGWASLEKREEQWWLLVKGKGDKWGHIPVNGQLLDIMKAYREALGKPFPPRPGESEPLIASRRTGRALKITQLYSLVKALGAQAAGLMSCPTKQQKLKALSPHWLRHLSASHQDRLGIPLASIQANLRHQSSQTTQLYVHAEEAARFLQMQTMQMSLKPAHFVRVAEVIGIEYRLTLSKGALNKEVALSRALLGIEKLLKDFDWVRVGESKPVLLKKAVEASVSAFKVVYRVFSKAVVEAPSAWGAALKRQCESWLFHCELQIQTLEHR